MSLSLRRFGGLRDLADAAGKQAELMCYLRVYFKATGRRVMM